MGSLMKPIVADIEECALKNMRAEIDVRKLIGFGTLFGGASGRGEGSVSNYADSAEW